MALTSRYTTTTTTTTTNKQKPIIEKMHQIVLPRKKQTESHLITSHYRLLHIVKEQEHKVSSS